MFYDYYKLENIWGIQYKSKNNNDNLKNNHKNFIDKIKEIHIKKDEYENNINKGGVDN